MKIISGGQTGIDRAALDVALQRGFPCGGWCPAGRRDELGRIPEHYPLTELSEGSYADRTRANVRDSDASVILYTAELEGGTKYAAECCRELNRPCLSIDASTTPSAQAASAMAEFVSRHRIETLGIGGPRQSEWAGGYDYACAALNRFFDVIRSEAL